VESCGDDCASALEAASSRQRNSAAMRNVRGENMKGFLILHGEKE
jgi:hypothetical protein